MRRATFRMIRLSSTIRQVLGSKSFFPLRARPERGLRHDRARMLTDDWRGGSATRRLGGEAGDQTDATLVAGDIETAAGLVDRQP